MQVTLHAPTVSPAIVSKIEQRVQGALERYEKLIRRASVRIKDENGPRGGRDQACTVRLELVGGREMVVRELQEQPLKAVGQAVKRLARRLSDRINEAPQRRRQHHTVRRDEPQQPPE